MSHTIRVELHDATGDDYARLHEAMESEGFSRLISSDDGGAYHLPWAEYDWSGNDARSSVLASAKRAASRTGREFAVLVTESKGRTWSGLQKA
jgi:hypothetical protein